LFKKEKEALSFKSKHIKLISSTDLTMIIDSNVIKQRYDINHMINIELKMACNKDADDNN